MYDRQVRVLGILAAVLVAMVAFLVFVEAPDDDGLPAREGTPDYERAFPEADVAAVQRLTLVAPSGRAVVERTDDSWRMTEPVDAPAAAGSIERWLDALVELEVSDPPVAEPGSDLAAFGLDDPTLLTAEGTDVSWAVRLGRDAPVGGATYVQARGEDVVRTSRTLVSKALPQTPDDLRDHRVVSLGTSPVDHLLLEFPDSGTDDAGLAVSVQRADGAWWVVANDRRLRADGGSIDKLIDAVAAAEADAFLSASERPTDPPLARIALTVGDAVHTVSVFRPVGGRLMAESSHQPGVVVLTEDLSSKLPPTMSSLLSTKLMPVRQDALTAAEVTIGTQALQATRGESGWEPPQAELVLSQIAVVPADRTRAAPTAEAETGRITLRRGDVADTVVLHQTVPAADGQPDLIVATEADGSAFFVDAAAIDALAAALGG